jgi:hypothetical protein
VGAALDDPALVHHEDDVGVADRSRSGSERWTAVFTLSSRGEYGAT